MKEELRSVAGKEGYRVSNLGRVFSDKSGKWLTNQTGDDGYHRVILKLNGKARNFRVHRLVAEAFLEPPPRGMVEECAAFHAGHGQVLVRHIDSNKLNNKLSNLAWGTHKDNSADYRAFRAAGHVPRPVSKVKRKTWKQLSLF